MKTRTIMIGAKRVVIANVPDDVSDEELKKFALNEMIRHGLSKNNFPKIGVGS